MRNACVIFEIAQRQAQFLAEVAEAHARIAARAVTVIPAVDRSTKTLSGRA
jgi:hypothetical protein